MGGDVAVGEASPAVLAGDVPLEWLHRPLPGRRPWPTLLVMSLSEWLHRPLPGWRPWPTLLVLSP